VESGVRHFCVAGHVESAMTQPAKAQEPSMEEILASIRRIISDDEAKPAISPSAAPVAAAPARAEPPKAPPPAARGALAPAKAKPLSGTPAPTAAAPLPTAAAKNSQDDIDAMMSGFDSAPAADDAEDEVFELTEQMAVPNGPPSSFQRVEPDDDLEFTEAHPAPTPVASMGAVRYDEPPREMLSTTTVSAVESAFNALASTVLSNNARTLEDLVKEMLRPMLKSWLDDNLPNLVERIVKAEIERVSRGR
jgi:uncharacterized protein